jgi:DNA-binding transcriptional ArsR family regulator
MIDQFGVDSGTLDFHLKKLLAVNLVARRKMGSGCLYHLNENIPVGLVQLFDADQKEGQLELVEEASLAL